MQAAGVSVKSEKWQYTVLWGGGIGLAVVLVAMVMMQMGLLQGVRGGTAVTTPHLTITAQDMRFGTEPVRVKVGQTVTLVLDNNDFLPHSFDVDALDIHAEMPMNQTTTLIFTPTQTGTFDLYCGVPGHRDVGMVGTVIVEP